MSSTPTRMYFGITGSPSVAGVFDENGALADRDGYRRPGTRPDRSGRHRALNEHGHRGLQVVESLGLPVADSNAAEQGREAPPAGRHHIRAATEVQEDLLLRRISRRDRTAPYGDLGTLSAQLVVCGENLAGHGARQRCVTEGRADL